MKRIFLFFALLFLSPLEALADQTFTLVGTSTLKVPGFVLPVQPTVMMLTLQDDGLYTQSVQVGAGPVVETTGIWLFESGKLQLLRDFPLASEMIVLTEDLISDLVGYGVVMTSLTDKSSIKVSTGLMTLRGKVTQTFRPGPNGKPLKVSIQIKLASF